MIAAQNDLTLPLIGNLSHDGEACATASNEETLDGDSSCMDHAFTVSRPVLLFLQFGLSFQAQNGTVEGVAWADISLSIVLFTLVTFLYGKALADANVGCATVHLLPEYIMVVVVALLFCHQHLALALFVLVGGVITLALVVVIFSVSHLLRNKRSCDTHDNDKRMALSRSSSHESSNLNTTCVL